MTHHTGSVPDTPRKKDWRDQAACRGHKTPDIFFATGNTTASYIQLAQAQDTCNACPVKADCRETAITARDPYGMWGGQTQDERRALLRIRVADGTDTPRRGHRARAECGTPSAYERHVKYGEPIDDACRAAHTRAAAERRARAKQAPKPRAAA
jgi:hypothetical protein